MGRIKALNFYQKSILLFMGAMVLVFAVIYSIVIDHEGFEYENVILTPSQENGNTVYSGKIQGEQACFTVGADKSVEFRYGNKTYGPYTAKEDPTAIPKDTELGASMTGVEIRKREEIFFRGGVLAADGFRWLYNEDGSLYDVGFSVVTGEGTIVVDENGKGIDLTELSVATILDLMAGPELTHKGDWSAWLLGAFLCFFTAVLILFADEIFRLQMSFQIRNADKAEPSDWEMAGRYVGWTMMPFAALICFIVGIR